MSTIASSRQRDVPVRALPIISFFEEDAVCSRHMVGVQRFRRMTCENLNGGMGGVENIVLVSSEDLVERNYNLLRAPHVRVLALATQTFKDPRNDGIVYAYLPPDVSQPLLERMVDNALDHIHLVHSRLEVNEKLGNVSREIHELNQIGVALSAERDPEKLLALILSKSREFTRSDAGSIYLVERIPAAAGEATAEAKADAKAEEKDAPPAEQLRFRLAQNDSVAVPFKEVTLAIDEKSVAGYVALTGEIVNIHDAYHLPPEVPYAINRKFDEDSGYRTKSVLAVPMRNHKDKIVGVLQLINAKRDFGVPLNSVAAILEQVVSFSGRQQEIVHSLASQAAVALENSQLYDAIQRLFEGFVRASVSAIEARDPATSGHSFRVANLTVALAECVDRAELGPFSGVRFTRDQMREIRYASLLHDFGKVGVREEILVKARKLYPAQMELIRQRFAFVRRTMENEILQAKVKYLLEKSREEFLASRPEFDRKLAEAVRQIDEYLKTIMTANEPSVLPEGNFQRLMEIGGVNYVDIDGSSRPLLSESEIHMLSIRQGSLDEQERRQIQAHVTHSFNFLQQIPWTSEIRNIPGIAVGHHEKLNGTGYPYKLSAPEIPLQTRMMTIADIFDALAAADRPYKKAVSVERALEILDQSVKDGELDAHLVDMFRTARVFDRWKVEPFPY